VGLLGEILDLLTLRTCTLFVVYVDEWHFGSGTLVPPVGFDSNNNQSLAFGGTKVPLPIKVRNISDLCKCLVLCVKK